MRKAQYKIQSPYDLIQNIHSITQLPETTSFADRA